MSTWETNDWNGGSTQSWEEPPVVGNHNWGGDDAGFGGNDGNIDGTIPRAVFDDGFADNGFASGAMNGNGGGGAGGGACNKCGKEGHYAKECTEGGPTKCYRCQKEGHMSSECDLPAVCPRCQANHTLKECPQPMVCRICGAEGHLAKTCPEAPPVICKNCQQEGHVATECKLPRKIDRADVPDVTVEEALNKIREAVEEMDIDDAKAAVQMYAKASPDTTYPELEAVFRAQNIGLYLIGIDKSEHLSHTLTNMDLQGNLEKKFTVTYRFSKTVPRPRERDLWPANDEENNTRLADGGEVVTRGIPKCRNCDELGHISKNCKEEKRENLEKTEIMCYNCQTAGHRMRDCPTPRVDKFACRNCHQPGHNSKECPEPRSAENVECRKCNEMGHFSKDCPKGGGSTCRNCGEEGHMARDCTEPKKMFCRNCEKEGHMARECPEPKDMSKFQCRNCDEYGHDSRGCPKPRDMSRVKCLNCGETGHYKNQCKNEHVADDNIDDLPGGTGGDANGGFGGGGDDFNTGGGDGFGGDDFAGGGGATTSDPW